MKSHFIVTLVTFILFNLEALIHFHIGRNGKKDKWEIHIPSAHEGIRIIGVVGLFSIMNSIVIHWLW